MPVMNEDSPKNTCALIMMRVRLVMRSSCDWVKPETIRLLSWGAKMMINTDNEIRISMMLFMTEEAIALALYLFLVRTSLYTGIKAAESAPTISS